MLKAYSVKSILLAFVLAAGSAFAQNPFITNQYTADPSARVFGDRIYVYASHDIPPIAGKTRPGWFAMEDYHVFSSDNLVDWKDHGLILSQTTVPWVKPDGYSMWAPDCVERDGKYYFYFPSIPKDTSRRGFKIGVAIADSPTGPFVPQASAIEKVNGIDPNVFVDKDGQAYLYWSQGEIYGAKLKANMLELDSEPVILEQLPSKGLKEGPFVFERNGIYYMTYPHVENKIERLEYATSKSPLGPFKVAGVIMDESPVGCWTNHHSITPFKNQWYLFYHSNDLSPGFDKNRSVRVDSLSFNTDGTIRKVVPTFRGVGLIKATSKIQIDRYSAISEKATTIGFLDTADKFKGWKTTFSGPDSWLRYNKIDFGTQSPSELEIRVKSKFGGTLEFHIGSANGPIISTVKVPQTPSWSLKKTKVSLPKTGIQDLIIRLKDGNDVEVDWVSFN